MGTRTEEPAKVYDQVKGNKAVEIIMIEQSGVEGKEVNGDDLVINEMRRFGWCRVAAASRKSGLKMFWLRELMGPN